MTTDPQGFCARFSIVVALMAAMFLLTPANMAGADSDDLGAEAREGEPEMMSPLVAINVSPENSVTPFAPHWIRTPEGR